MQPWGDGGGRAGELKERGASVLSRLAPGFSFTVEKQGNGQGSSDLHDRSRNMEEEGSKSQGWESETLDRGSNPAGG